MLARGKVRTAQDYFYSCQSQETRFPDEPFRRTVLGGTPVRSDPMPSPFTDLPDAFVAATTASLQAQREKLMRRVRNQRILMRIILGLSGCEALFALAAYLNGDYAVARFCAVTSCIVFAFAYIAGTAARKKAVDALREMDLPS
jgi:hypothetical protein